VQRRCCIRKNLSLGKKQDFSEIAGKMHKTYILHWCKLQTDQLLLDGVAMPFERSGNTTDRLKGLYQSMQLEYPKFFKMDELCKLAFLGAEMLFQKNETTFSPSAQAVILANASSTLETDRKHQQSIADKDNFFPSPAIFVYTLPNITIGEISIRHQIKGENTFFVFPQYDLDFMCRYVDQVLTTTDTELVLTGWVEYSATGFECFLYLAGTQPAGLKIEHNPKNAEILYNSEH
jgi:hypothetical protein